MYLFFLSLHSIVRWLVLFSLIYSIYRGYIGWIKNNTFSKKDRLIRQFTASFAHIQLVIGVVLYFISPTTEYFMSHFSEAMKIPAISFFGMSHTATMFIAVVLITIGSIMSKKAVTDRKKFSIMAIYFSIALLLILVMIPWSFSPFAQRPLLRLF